MIEYSLIALYLKFNEGEVQVFMQYQNKTIRAKEKQKCDCEKINEIVKNHWEEAVKELEKNFSFNAAEAIQKGLHNYFGTEDWSTLQAHKESFFRDSANRCLCAYDYTDSTDEEVQRWYVWRA